MTKPLSISPLIRQGQTGNIRALKRLYELFVREMLTTSYRILNDRQGAEDVIQESFVTAFERLNSLDQPERFKYWLKRIVINKSLQRIRSRINWKPMEELEFVEDETEEQWWKDIPMATINKAIQELPEGCRQVFTLYLMDDFKHREIAEQLDISVSTSKSQYRYALKTLRQSLTKNEDHEI